MLDSQVRPWLDSQVHVGLPLKATSYSIARKIPIGVTKDSSESYIALYCMKNAGLDLHMRVSTFLLEPEMPHLLSENAGLDLDM